MRCLQLKFHSVDLLLKIVEHQLETPDKLDTIEEIFLCVKSQAKTEVPTDTRRVLQENAA